MTPTPVWSLLMRGGVRPVLDIDQRIIHANDDGYVYAGGPSFYPNTERQIVGKGSTSGYYSWYRFQNLIIPNGQTIATAHLWAEAYSTSSTNWANSNLWGEAADDPSAPINYAEYFSKTRTATSVYWEHIAAHVANTEYSSPDIKTIIQEIVNRPGWVSGYSILLFSQNYSSSTSAFRTYKSFDVYPDNAARLVITF